MNQSIRVLTFVCVALSVGTSAASAAPSAKEEKAIEHLLDYIEQSPNTFVLTGQEYNAEKAVAFIRQKYEFEESRISTANEFIDRAATKGVTEKRFLLKRTDGTETELKGWLANELKRYRDEHPF